MYIRMLTGPYKDRIRDVVFEAARDLIKSGQAVEVDFNAADAQQQIVTPSVPATTSPAAPRIAKASRQSRKH